MKRIQFQKSSVLYFSVCSLLLVASSAIRAEDVVVSQDILFDYSSASTGFSNGIISRQTQLDSITAQIALMQTATGYSSMVTSAVEALTTQQTSLTASMADMQAVLDEITTISNLSAGIKSQLYNLYILVGGSYIDFMVRMPFNYQAILADTTILALLEDITNTSELKTAMAQFVYQDYPMGSAHIRSLVLLYKYLQ